MAYGFVSQEENGQLSGQTTTFRQAGSSAGVAILSTIFMANIAMGAGTLADIIEPGFRHAFFAAVIISLVAFLLAMASRNAERD